MKNFTRFYSVGTLLYCPANNTTIAESIINNKFEQPFSLALCLEDTINDKYVDEAERILGCSLEKICKAGIVKEFYLPEIFIRVRNTEQLLRLYSAFGDCMRIVTGFIAPKFAMDNADKYIDAIAQLNEKSKEPVYLMPIFESPSIIDLRYRYDILYNLKDKLSAIEDRVLCIRVGGNDLCHVFGFRRHDDESIHRIKPVAQIFSDIITVYGNEYVVSGPVWEYFNGGNWKQGLINEIADDKLCGFTGKTVIHPNQIKVVNDAYAVEKRDFESAKSILSWNTESHSLVSADIGKERMDELKTHTNWAKKILFLSEVYGIN